MEILFTPIPRLASVYGRRIYQVAGKGGGKKTSEMAIRGEMIKQGLMANERIR